MCKPANTRTHLLGLILLIARPTNYYNISTAAQMESKQRPIFRSFLNAIVHICCWLPVAVTVEHASRNIATLRNLRYGGNQMYETMTTEQVIACERLSGAGTK